MYVQPLRTIGLLKIFTSPRWRDRQWLPFLWGMALVFIAMTMLSVFDVSLFSGAAHKGTARAQATSEQVEPIKQSSIIEIVEIIKE